MGTENAFTPFTRLVADRNDSAGSFSGNVAFYKTSTEIIIKLVLACFPKLKNNENGKNGFFQMKGSTSRNKTPGSKLL